MKIYVRDESGNFIIVPLGNVLDEEIVNAVKLLVPEWALQSNKPTYTASEVGTYSSKELDNYFKNQAETISKKTEETVLYEGVVNTPVWTNQPTVDGNNTDLSAGEVYYVTLNDADGNALPSGQFMLKSSFDSSATVYPVVFSLADLNTGTATLAENHPIELGSIGINPNMRDAGITLFEQGIDAWNIGNGTGSLRIVVNGEVIPMVNANLYCYSQFIADEVAFYHSANGTTSLQGTTIKDIVAYTPIPELSNLGNLLFDDTVIKKDGNGYFSIERKIVVRYNENYKNAKSYQVFGFGKANSDDTNITKVYFRVNNVKNGMLRNGTSIIISEVK